ncbi:putative phage integrase [Mycobacteroides abscessus subsp. abscessus]|nr:hypothetical protein [Mycobacteroides abscessus]MDO3101238.1 hypothetical protein [Mycobacteroides abscessus subsp. abscessus]SIN21920.1 putative phage integrase [Mycobacteroides abscessus subsp. abscessus]
MTPPSFGRSVGTVVTEGMEIDAAQESLGHAQRETTDRHYVQRSMSGPDIRAVIEHWAGQAN